MITFRRRIFMFCMFFVRILKILYLWFFISWWRLDAEFLCFVCLSYECSEFFISDSLSHDHVQTQNFYVLYVFRTNAQNSLSLILYLMITFRRKISVFCMSFVRMLRILYLWFFISWSRSDAEFLCFVCLLYECSEFFIFDSLSHDHVQTQNFCVLYVFRTNVQNSLSLILYLMITFRRRISVFCMSFVRMLRILYLWFFISWWRLDAEFLCFVCLSYECSKFFTFDSLSHDHVQTQSFCVLYVFCTNAQNSLSLILYLMITFCLSNCLTCVNVN
jgi:hypothetical protein